MNWILEKHDGSLKRNHSEERKQRCTMVAKKAMYWIFFLSILSLTMALSVALSAQTASPPPDMKDSKVDLSSLSGPEFRPHVLLQDGGTGSGSNSGTPAAQGMAATGACPADAVSVEDVSFWTRIRMGFHEFMQNLIAPRRGNHR